MTTVIFSDLDGCLLDHDDYAWSAARPALERIRQDRVPLVFVTSKTRAEVEALHDVMQLDEPFIVENGGAIYLPQRYWRDEISDARRFGRYRVVTLGRAYDEIRAFVSGVRERFGLTGFGDLSVAEVGRLAGLSAVAAERARQREFTEPFVIDPEAQLSVLQNMAAMAGLQVVRGGRFHHLIGSGQDKGIAVARLQQIFRSGSPHPVSFIGLGDGPNDLPLLRAVDVAVRVPNPAVSRFDTGLPDLIEAAEPGARGWNDVVLQQLDRLRR